jgi:beta-glucosidase
MLFTPRPALLSLLLGATLALTVQACTSDGVPDGGGDPSGFKSVSFPDDFEWGTAVAQWQVAGDARANGGEPIDSNWGRFLAIDKAKDGQRNPDGNGFMTGYEADLDLAASLGLKAFRISLDWSRVEPSPGVYDDAEIAHFVGVLEAANARGLKPVLTFWHWVVPAWVQNPDPATGYVDMLADDDGEIVTRFEAMVRYVLPSVAPHVDTYTTLNEPFSIISAGYMAATFPPGRIFPDVPAATRVGLNLIFMHAKAYDAIKELDTVDADDDGVANFVGLTQTANLFYTQTGSAQEELAKDSIGYVFNDWIMIALLDGQLDVNLDGDALDIDTVPKAEGHYPDLENRLDFIGVQYYGPVVIREEPLLAEFHPLYGYPMITVEDYDATLPHNGMGRQISAAGFADTIDHYAQWNIPILLTENGTTTNGLPVEDDAGTLTDLPRSEDQAAMYLMEHLWEVGRAIERGVDIRAYYHWTLADNFEWVEGARQRFGAYTVDFDDVDRPRTLTKMGDALRDVVEKNGIDEELWQTYVLERYPSDTREEGGLTTREPVYEE